MKRKISRQKDKIDELLESLDDLEQEKMRGPSFSLAWSNIRARTHLNSLEIIGIPESIQDNEGADLKIADALNVQVRAEDIDICHRVKRERSNPRILRFVSHKVKSSLYEQRFQLKNVHFVDLFPDATALVLAQAIFH